MRLIFTNTSGSGVQAALTSGEDLYLAEGVYFGSTNNYAITSEDSNHRIDVYGHLVSQSGINLGDDVSDTNNRVFVHSGAEIRVSDEIGLYWGIYVYGSSSSIVNDGVIDGHFGVVFKAASPSTSSTITNSGTIIGYDTTVGTVTRDIGSTETLIVNNTGLIEGEVSFTSNLGNGVDIINNSGTMIGDVILAGLDDKYNGKKGFVDGIVDGGEGADTLNGGLKLDHFLGGAGADTLYGNIGKDKLGGGADADTFIYKAVAESAGKTVDTILDFSKAEDDLFNIHAIDANTTKSGNQDFTFIGNAAFDGDKGDLRFFVSGGNTTFQADINGDKKADFTVKLTGEISLAASDFLL
jgi:Ca2+-binding RTX toxin-like protein